MWLAPKQAVLIPIADRHLDYAYELAKRFKQAGLRVSVDARAERINIIRDAQNAKVPYMLVIGGCREMEAGQVALRRRNEKARAHAGRSFPGAG